MASSIALSLEQEAFPFTVGGVGGVESLWPPGTLDACAARPTVQLELQSVEKTYPNGFRALHAVSLPIPRGMFGLLGPNGAGKSTLMRSIATLQEVDAGTLRFGDIDIRKHKERLREVLGHLPQDFGVYPKVTAWDMLEHLAELKGFTDRKSRRDAVAALLRRTSSSTSRSSANHGDHGARPR